MNQAPSKEWYEEQERLQKQREEETRQIVMLDYYKLTPEQRLERYAEIERELKTLPVITTQTPVTEETKKILKQRGYLSRLKNYYDPFVSVTYFDVAPFLPCVVFFYELDAETHEWYRVPYMMTHMTFHKRKSFNNGEEYVQFHLSEESKHDLRIPNTRRCMTREITITRGDAESFGLITSPMSKLPSSFIDKNDDRPALKNGIHLVKYES